MTDGTPGAFERHRWLAPLLILLTVGVLLLIFGWEFLQDPSRTAATRDPAWYTWRSGVIVHSDPSLVAGDWGPFHMFGGGYRVAVPVIGAILANIAGTAQSSFAAVMMVMVPILAGLAFGAAAWRSTKSYALYIVTMLVTGVFYLTTPYVGYLDNLFVLYVLASIIAFMEPARRSWGARSAIVLLSVLAAYTHPTTCVVFIGTLVFVLLFHMLTMRFNFRALLDRDLPVLLSVMGGMIGGLILWPLGKFLLWGVAGNLADAALPPPYTREFFMDRLMEWVNAQYPLVVIPLILLAIFWIWKATKREQKPADPYRTMISWWLLPYGASIAFVVGGAVLPYYRFMNSTAAIMPLTALGAWAIGWWLWRKTGRNFFVGALACLVFAGALFYGFTNGLETSRWNDPTNQWIDQDTRVALASVQSIVDSDPARPIVFVNNWAQDSPAYGWSKTYANVGRAGLRGDTAVHTFQYFGDLEDFLAGKRTVTNPDCDEILNADEVNLTAITGGKLKDENGDVVKDDNGDAVKLPARPECTYDLVSRGFLDESTKGVEEHGGTPFVFMLRKFNEKSANLTYFDQPSSDMIPLGPDVLLVTGDGYATPSPEAVDAAVAAGKTEADHSANHPGRFDDPMHLLRVLLGIFLLIALPGLIAARWFEVEGWQIKIGLIPPVSIALNVIAAIAVIAVTRSPFGIGPAVASVAVANLAAVGLLWLSFRRTAEKPGPLASLRDFVGRMATIGGTAIDKMSVPFRELKDFRALMLTQFLSMAGDGVVAGTILLNVLNPDNAKTGRDLMAIVFLTYLPFALLAPFVGSVADRFDRRRLLVAVNYARAVLIVFAAAMLVANLDAVALLSALALLVLAGFRLTLLVKGAGLPDAVEGKDLLLANSLSQAGGTIFQAGGAVAAVGFTTIFKNVNEGWVALLAVVCYLAAAYFARGIRKLESGSPNESFGSAMRGVFRNIGEGIGEIRQRPASAIGILSFWFTRTLVFGFIGLSLSFAVFESVTGKSGGGQTEAIISLFFAGLGAGIGLFLAQYLKDKVAPAKVIVTNMIVAGGFALLVPFTSIGRYAATFVAGLAFFMVKVAADTVTQQALPDNFRGRAYALFDISYALSYALPAAVLYLAATGGLNLDVVVAAYGGVLLLLGLAMSAWARRLNLYHHTSDDLSEEELVTGVED